MATDNDNITNDVAIDDEEEKTKADLLKPDPSDEEAEKTIAASIIDGAI